MEQHKEEEAFEEFEESISLLPCLEMEKRNLFMVKNNTNSSSDPPWLLF